MHILIGIDEAGGIGQFERCMILCFKIACMQVPLYLFNPTYVTSTYGQNVDRVQSAMLRIKSATATQWTTIRNLSAIETTLVSCCS